MIKYFLPLSLFSLITSFFFLSSFNTEKNTNVLTVNRAVADSMSVAAEAASAEAKTNTLYEALELNKLGLSKEALAYAIKGFDKLNKKGALSNTDILTVVDFSQPASKKRMYIIDMSNHTLLLNTYVAHGKNTGGVTAERFSNVPESLQSSLGFYVTKNTYFGKHGLSLRLEGLDKGFNENAMSRAIVVHGAAYIGQGRTGRSFGCPAVPQEHAGKVINWIKDGSAMFIYKPDQKYLSSSKVLNG